MQDRRYLEAVDRVGGVPVLIPVPASSDTVIRLAGEADGFLLPGSPTDIDPSRYGESRHEKLGSLFPERDETDFLLIEIAEKRRLPVFGICHGMQTLNVWRGGSLIQDIASEVSGSVRHHDPERPKESPAHSVRVDSDSRLAGMLGEDCEVNSSHHQAVRRAGRGLRAVALAPDGVVEAIEDTGSVFVVGVQWHPEAGWDETGPAQALFGSFIRAAGGSIDW